MAVGCPLTNVVDVTFAGAGAGVELFEFGAGGGLMYCGGPFLSFGCVVMTAGDDL